MKEDPDMGFQAQQMLGQQVLISGTDTAGVTGQTILDSSQWDDLNARNDVLLATEEFDQVVSEMFAPVIAAAEKVEAALEGPALDPLAYVVIEEGVEGVEAKPRRIEELTTDSIILRLIDVGDTDRLRWVHDGTVLVVLAS